MEGRFQFPFSSIFFPFTLCCIFRVSKLYFHLEDDSLAVVELAEENSGMTQGRIVRRHQVPFKEIDPDAGDHLFITLFQGTLYDITRSAGHEK